MANQYDIPEDISFGGEPEPGQQSSLESSGESAAPTAQPNQFDPNMMITYKASGKDRTETLDTILKRASKGFDYAQLVNQHKQQVDQWQSQFNERQRQLQEMEQRWKPYDEYAAQNPGWGEYVRDQWQSRFNWQNPGQNAGQMQQSEFDPNQNSQASNNMHLPPEVRQELAEMRQFRQSMERERQLARQAQEDQNLHNEIQNVRNQYSDIDFDNTDPETGESLEAQVLRHAQQNRIHNFAAAFKDLYFDKLLDRHVMKAKENVAKQMQQQTKQGFIAKSDNSMLSPNRSPQNNVSRARSWNEFADAVIADMGINQ